MSDTPTTDRCVKNCNGWHHVPVERARELERELNKAQSRISELEAEVARLHKSYDAYEHEIQQLLGKALGWPWYKDDQKNFPGATEADGVFVGEHVAVTLAAEIAEAYAKALARIKELEQPKVLTTQFESLT